MIYFAKLESGPIKIGHSYLTGRRIKQLECSLGQHAKILATMPGGQAHEDVVHERFAHLRLGDTEQFRPDPELMEYIAQPYPLMVNVDAVVPAKRRTTRPAAIHVNCTLAYRDAAREVMHKAGFCEFPRWIESLIEKERKRLGIKKLPRR